MLEHGNEITLHLGKFAFDKADLVGPAACRQDHGGIFQVGAKRHHAAGDAE